MVNRAKNTKEAISKSQQQQQNVTKHPAEQQKQVKNVQQQQEAKVVKGKSNKKLDPEKLCKTVMDISQTSHEEAMKALREFNFDPNAAANHLLESNQEGEWTTSQRKRKPRAPSASKNGEGSAPTATAAATTSTNNMPEATSPNDARVLPDPNQRPYQRPPSYDGHRGARRSGPSAGGRFNDRAPHPGRTWSEQETNNRDDKRGMTNENGYRGGRPPAGSRNMSGRGFRGRDRMPNGVMSRGGSRGRGGGRGMSGPRPYGGSFTPQIDTWNPDDDGGSSKPDSFPSPEDWDNEEYTGSLADTKVFTPSTAAIAAAEPIESAELSSTVDVDTVRDEQPQNIQVAAIAQQSNTSLNPAQSEFFNKLMAHGGTIYSEKSSAASTFSSTVTPTPPPPPVVTTTVEAISTARTQQPTPPLATTAAPSYVATPAVSAASVPSQAFSPSPQSYSQRVSSQMFHSSTPPPIYQPTASSPSAFARTSEYSSSNYSDAMYNAHPVAGTQNNGTLQSLPQRSPSQRSTPRQEAATKSMIMSTVELQSTTDNFIMNSMKCLDAFSDLTFDDEDGYEVPASGASVAEAGTVIVGSFTPSSTAPADLTSIGAFQPASQSTTAKSAGGNISSVLRENTNKEREGKKKVESKTPKNTLSAESGLPSATSDVYAASSPTMVNARLNASDTSMSYGLPPEYQPGQSAATFPKANTASSYHQAPGYGAAAYSTTPPTTTSNGNAYVASQQQQQQPSQMQQNQPTTTSPTSSSNNAATSAAGQFSVYSGGHSVAGAAAAAATPPLQSSIYHNSFQTHPSVTSHNFPSYMSYPNSFIQQYPTGAAGLAQSPYVGTQYGNGSMTNLGTYGTAPFNSGSYSLPGSLQTPVATLPQNNKMSGSSITNNAVSKESQYDGLQSMTTSTSNSTNTNPGSSVNAQTTTTTSTTKVTSSTTSTTGKTSSGIMGPPPGVAPIIGPQYFMSSPYYSSYMNFDEMYLTRGMHPHMGYVDMNYPSGGPQSTLGGRESLNMSYSSMPSLAADGRYAGDSRYGPRPDNATSPAPPMTATQGAAAAHQQPIPPMITYVYPSYQPHYPGTLYQMTPNGPGSANTAVAGPAYKPPAGYGPLAAAAAINSQYEPATTAAAAAAAAATSSAGGAEYSTGVGNAAAKGGAYQPAASKASSATNAAQGGPSEMNIYGSGGKSHPAMAKFEKQQTAQYHPATAAQFIPGVTSMNSMPAAQAVAASFQPQAQSPQIYLPHGGAPTPAHQLHQQNNQQDGGDIRNAGNNERNYYISSNRSFR